MSLPLSRPLWLLVLSGSAALYGGDTGNLARKSPFMPPASGAAAAAPTENSPLELRGVLGAGAEALFNIYDPSRKRSAWVKANEADGRDFVVRSFDEGGLTAQVEHGGRTLTLKLAESKIVPLAVNAAPVPAPGAPTPAVVNPTPADEARRLESVAAEVRRRRALRAAAAQQQQQQQPQPAQQPARPGTPPPR